MAEKQTASNKISAKAGIIKVKFGKKLLTDEELLILATESINRSFTFEEKGYR